MCVWRELDTKSVLKRLRVLSIIFAVPVLIAIIFVFYQDFLGYSVEFYSGYGLFFEYTSLGLKYLGELIFPLITNATVFIALIFIISLTPLLIINTWIAFFIRPFKDVRGFENYGKVCKETESFIVQGSNREKLIVVAFTLTSILTYLFASLWFTGELGMLTPTYFSSFLLFLFIIDLLGLLYFGFRIERALKRYLETVKV
ncbi:MAG: hypothetical protein ACETWM_07945 [Candidatus Lokiarchaeia archaeon]